VPKLHAILGIAALLAVPSIIAQPASSQAKTATFEAATIKPVAPSGVGLGDGTGKMIRRKQAGGAGGNYEDAGRIHYQESLRLLLERAYNVPRVQIKGPEWLSTPFVVDAIMPPQTTREQLQIMLQNLLAERFKLAVHRETEQVSGYSLIVAKNGPKLKESAGDQPPIVVTREDFEKLAETLGPDGFPKTIGWSQRTIEQGVAVYGSPLGRKVFFRDKTMPELAVDLWERLLDSPVRDATGLSSRYDFSLTYMPDDARAPSGPPAGRYASAPDLFKAVESQLGLKLEKGKIPVEMLVVDHIEKSPSEN
jgi:uncharacterized protein (TIGR03435 family)